MYFYVTKDGTLVKSSLPISRYIEITEEVYLTLASKQEEEDTDGSN